MSEIGPYRCIISVSRLYFWALMRQNSVIIILFCYLCLSLGGPRGIPGARRWPGRSTPPWSAGLPRKARSGCHADGPVGLATSPPGSRSTPCSSRCSCRRRRRAGRVSARVVWGVCRTLTTSKGVGGPGARPLTSSLPDRKYGTKYFGECGKFIIYLPDRRTTGLQRRKFWEYNDGYLSRRWCHHVTGQWRKKKDRERKPRIKECLISKERKEEGKKERKKERRKERKERKKEGRKERKERRKERKER